MEIIFVKNYTIELKDGSAGLFRAGQVVEFDDETTKEIVRKGYAVRRK